MLAHTAVHDVPTRGSSPLWMCTKFNKKLGVRDRRLCIGLTYFLPS